VAFFVGGILLRFTIILQIVTGLVIWTPVQSWSANSNVSDRVEKPVRKAIDIRQKTQKERDLWREERQRLVDAYETLQQEQKQLEAQKDSLTQTSAAATERIAAKSKQLADIEQISVQIQPFLDKLIQQLHQRVNDDMPFLSDERGRRLDKLDRLSTDPGVAVSEKFRKIMEALMVEAEYGRTIEVYQETIEVDNREILANIFRLGRIALFYQTLDQKRCGFYNVASSTWSPLPKSYHSSIQTAMDIGLKRRPVELLTLPIGRITVR
jgi:small-conductance mechanosensitive channel